MKHNNSIVHTIVIKLLFIVGLSVCIVTTVFSNTTKQLEDIQTPQKSVSPLLAVKTNLIYWVGIMPDFKHYRSIRQKEGRWRSVFRSFGLEP